MAHLCVWHVSASHKTLGFLDAGHYNLHGFEKRHYNSRYWIFAITILTNPESCPILRLARIWRVYGPTCRFCISVWASLPLPPSDKAPRSSSSRLSLLSRTPPTPDQNSPPPPRSRAPAPASLAAARIPRRCWMPPPACRRCSLGERLQRAVQAARRNRDRCLTFARFVRCSWFESEAKSMRLTAKSSWSARIASR